MKRYGCLLGLMLLPLVGQAAESTDLKAFLELNKAKNRGLTLYVNGNSVDLAVMEVTETAVLGRSQRYGRIWVRLDRIDAAVSPD